MKTQNKKVSVTQTRLDEIVKKGTVALDAFYKRHGEWDGRKKQKRPKIKRDHNGVSGPYSSSFKKRGRKPKVKGLAS
jgi:hypothetical protein